ncbi:MAG: apolipoprotein N-acyltransferase, partial [candidate division NC10 bacterium]|nr:apolipoprotein N-acyltransferase [candidate division NC10 bacterium]
MSLAFAGTGDQGWLAFGALVPLLVAVPGVTWRHAAIIGAISSLMFWLITLSWVVPTMVRHGGLPWFLASPILLGLAGYLA